MPFITVGATMVDLNTRLPPGSGWELESARAINDNGWITGYGSINGQEHAYLLKPNAGRGGRRLPCSDSGRLRWARIETEAIPPLSALDRDGMNEGIRGSAAGTRTDCGRGANGLQARREWIAGGARMDCGGRDEMNFFAGGRSAESPSETQGKSVRIVSEGDSAAGSLAKEFIPSRPVRAPFAPPGNAGIHSVAPRSRPACALCRR